MSTLKKEWQWCLQQSCRKKKIKIGHQYARRLTDTWQMSLSGCSLLCNAHLKGGGKKPSSRHLVLEWNHIVDNLLLRCHVIHCCHEQCRRAGHSAVGARLWLQLRVFWVFFIKFFSFVCTAARLPCRRGLEPSPILLLCISSELINSLGLYDWGDCLGALNPIQLIKS